MSGVGKGVVELTARVATEAAYDLGEGITWDPVRRELVWVDILAGTLHRGVLAASGMIEPTDVLRFGETVAAVGIARSGDMMVAGARDAIVCRRDGTVTERRKLIRGPGRRLNDGKPDPVGRFLVGTMSHDFRSRTDSLLRLDTDGAVAVLDDDLTVSNGLGWAANGTRMFSVDTVSRRIFCRDYDPASGDVGPRSVFATVADGLPDGLTVDADDHVWVALWGAGRVLRLDPTGAVVGIVRVPAPHVSSVAFAGRNLHTLVITTARDGLSSEDLAEFPLSGRIFTAAPPVRGVAPYLWAGPMT